MNRKSRLLCYLWTGLAGLALLLFIVGHEIVHEGNQDRLFFPALQQRKAFELITGLPYQDEAIHYFRWGADWDSDAWYYLVAEMDRSQLDSIIVKKSAERAPFDPASFRSRDFPGIDRPEDPEYYTLKFSRKGSLDIWYDPESRMLFLADLWL